MASSIPTSLLPSGRWPLRAFRETAGEGLVMLTIGMLGGMSWESSAEYYRLVNEFVGDRLGGLHSARCVLVSVDFAEIERLQATGDWDKAAAVLARAARRVEAGGADLLVLCTNTMHKVAAQVQAAVTIPQLDLADVTAEAVLAAGLTTIGLLGTAVTMEQAFYRDRLASHGRTVLVPTARTAPRSTRSSRNARQLRTRIRAASGDDVADLLGRAVLGVKGGGPLG
jgi:aspartate racemase